MITLKRILHPTDFSECSQKAMAYAATLAERFGAELHLVHVLENPFLGATDPGAGFFLPADYLTEVRQSAEKLLARLPSTDQPGVKTVVRAIRQGPTYAEIVRYAKEHDIDLIVLGTHGRGGFSHMLLGSIAEKVVRKSPCPVLTVHPEGHQFVEP